MQRLFLLLNTLFIMAAGFACTGQMGGGADSPTEAYKQLYTAVKSKDTEAIKKVLTKKTIDFGAMTAQRYNNPIEKAYENGFTATTFSDTLPRIRDERIKDDMGSVEVWNSKDSRWEDLPFIKEDGGWKLAVGDLFAGNFKRPAPGLDSIEKEAANAAAGQPSPAVNSNAGGPANIAPAVPPTNKNTK